MPYNDLAIVFRTVHLKDFQVKRRKGDTIMSEKRKPTVYTSEFRESSVKLATQSGRPVSQIAKELGINENTLHTWIAKYSTRKEGSMRTTDHHFDEIKRLKKELAHVTQERDLLKKAAAYFAKESR
jgi:transposase